MKRHIVITGAGSGLGNQTALRFAERGDAVTLVDIDLEALKASADICRAAGSESVTAIRSDLTSPDEPEAMISQAWAVAPIDVLVNAAGIYPSTPLLALNAKIWDAVLDLNTRAPMLATVALAQRVRAGGTRACVVNISSGAAVRARPGAAAYSASKAALEMLTRASALELGAYGIRVNAVAPGFVNVNSTANPLTDEYIAAADGRNPLGRPGKPDDIARAVLWLAGDEAEWITGVVLRVDGGSSIGTTDLPMHGPAPEKFDTQGNHG